MGKRLDGPARFPAELTLPKRKRAPGKAPAPRMNRAAAGLEERRVLDDNTPHLDTSPAPDFMEELAVQLSYLVLTGLPLDPAAAVSPAGAVVDFMETMADALAHVDEVRRGHPVASPVLCALDFVDALESLFASLVRPGPAPPTADEARRAEDRRRLAALLPADR